MIYETEELAAEYLARLLPEERLAATDRIKQLVRKHIPSERAAEEADAAEAERREATEAELAAMSKPLEFTFTARPAIPAYTVRGVFRRGSVNMISGDTGTCKSMLAQDLIVALILGGKWLGHDVLADWLLYIDEENPDYVPIERVWAITQGRSGTPTDEQRARFEYVCRQGVTLGTEEWNRWLRWKLERRRADGSGIVVIDTAMAATSAEVNDNDLVVKLYKQLRPLAAEFKVTILLLHHDRKESTQPGATVNSSQATMGARQWVGQADRHLTLRKLSARPEVTELANGAKELRREIAMKGGAKDRMEDGGESHDELIVATSLKREDGSMDWLKITNEGEIEPTPTDQEELAAEFVEIVTEADAPLKRAAIFEAAEVKPAQESTAKRALADTVKGPRSPLVKAADQRGVYELRPAKKGGLGI